MDGLVVAGAERQVRLLEVRTRTYSRLGQLWVFITRENTARFAHLLNYYHYYCHHHHHHYNHYYYYGCYYCCFCGCWCYNPMKERLLHYEICRLNVLNNQMT